MPARSWSSGVPWRLLDLRAPVRVGGAPAAGALRILCVTPLNPLGALDEAENRARLAAFRASLGEAFGVYVEATGRSPDGAHREAGVALLTSESEARALATESDQDAFFWFDGAAFWLIGAGADPTRERLPSPGGGTTGTVV